jgi:hypothetical protein
MSKPYTESDFSSQISGDRTWRLKEISDLKSSARAAKDANLQRVLLRALLAICYAHWEGYVRLAARKYMEFVAIRKFQYQELNSQFLRNYFLPRLAALSQTKSSISERCVLVDEIRDASVRRFVYANSDLIDTKSNLNFKVLADICAVCSVPVTLFAGEEDFIDRFLLKRRNAIAHGEETYIEIDDVDELTDRTIALMRTFGNALENFVVLSQYRAIGVGTASATVHNCAKQI